MSSKFEFFTTDEIKPQGWLKDQLIIQAKGLSGNLDKMWPDIRDSKWVGGDKEGWERVPYWLDGFIPLAYLLGDEDMKKRAKRYVDAIIAGQQEDGWLCPCSKEERKGYDMWALYLMLKVLVVYYDCSKDERVEEVVYKALKNYMAFDFEHTAFNWAAARWFECLIPIRWLYERRKEKWLLTLASMLEFQGIDYEKARSFNAKTYAPEVNGKRWTFYAHVVNQAMYLKTDAVKVALGIPGSENHAIRYLDYVRRHHGNVNGYFNGDECFSGTAANRGTELCGVAEAMYSHEVSACVFGTVRWMDEAERLAFNSFPATVSQDMWTHQYDQMSNQPYCVKLNAPHFNTNGSEAHLFGLEPNYGCCTANFNQAFPKFALSTYMKASDGIVVSSLAPSSLNCLVNGVKVNVVTDTLYPFRDDVTIRVKTEKPVAFRLYVRVPGFVDGATLDGKAVKTGEYAVVEKTFAGDEIKLHLINSPRFVKRGSLVAVVRGALTYSLPVKEKWVMHEYERNGVERKFPYCDYELFAESEWQYGFSSTALEYEERGDYECAFSTAKPLCAVKAKVKKIKWGYAEKGNLIARSTPLSRKPVGDEETVYLIPYGCAKLRMTELPLLDK